MRKRRGWTRRWGQRWRAARGRLGAFPSAIRLVVVTTVVLALVALANLVYQLAHKPTEMLFPMSRALAKTPAETWREYGPLFREYSTGAVSPELLAALAQIESTGNPIARTYWRWRLTWNPFAVYAPASSAVGMFQMTDPAFAEARRFCVRKHVVAADGCGFGPYIRVVPSHAVELASVYLDRNVAAVLAGLPNTTATAAQKQDVAALIHLCGAGPARAFARRNFRLLPGERCGDHGAGAYLAKVNDMKRQFVKLAAGS
jgi:Transglycosylase SLT domain